MPLCHNATLKDLKIQKTIKKLCFEIKKKPDNCKVLVTIDKTTEKGNKDKVNKPKRRKMCFENEELSVRKERITRKS
jgi:hypothetical protein